MDHCWNRGVPSRILERLEIDDLDNRLRRSVLLVRVMHRHERLAADDGHVVGAVLDEIGARWLERHRLDDRGQKRIRNVDDVELRYPAITSHVGHVGVAALDEHSIGHAESVDRGDDRHAWVVDVRNDEAFERGGNERVAIRDRNIPCIPVWLDEAHPIRSVEVADVDHLHTTMAVRHKDDVVDPSDAKDACERHVDAATNQVSRSKLLLTRRDGEEQELALHVVFVEIGVAVLHGKASEQGPTGIRTLHDA